MPAIPNSSLVPLNRRRWDRDLDGALKSFEPGQEAPVRSLLSEFFEVLNQLSRDSVNFEDLSGVTFDFPELALPARHYVHRCEYCIGAKSSPGTHLDCIRNKLAIIRKISKRAQVLDGVCHAGMTEVVHPWVYGGRLLGVFFYGGVVLHETESKAVARLERYCLKRGLESRQWLMAHSRVPRISRTELDSMRIRLRWVAEVATRILEANAIPADRYQSPPVPTFFRSNPEIPKLVVMAIQLVHRRYTEPLNAKVVSSELRCSSDYLGRRFKKSMGLELSEYIASVRLERARTLLRATYHTIGEVAAAVGMPDQSHFSRVFRRHHGMTPHHYRQSREA